MDKPTQEQIKEFWEWCGWGHMPGLGLISPDGEDLVPPIDLNNLFKHAVPMALSKMKWTQWFHFMTSWAIKIYNKEDPALALFWALWQVKETSR